MAAVTGAITLCGRTVVGHMEGVMRGFGVRRPSDTRALECRYIAPDGCDGVYSMPRATRVAKE